MKSVNLLGAVMLGFLAMAGSTTVWAEPEPFQAMRVQDTPPRQSAPLPAQSAPPAQQQQGEQPAAAPPSRCHQPPRPVS